jgi:hypothetical protein
MRPGSVIFLQADRGGFSVRHYFFLNPFLFTPWLELKAVLILDNRITESVSAVESLRRPAVNTSADRIVR